MNEPKAINDRAHGAIYVYLEDESEAAHHTSSFQSVSGVVNLDFNREGDVIGIEILYPGVTR